MFCRSDCRLWAGMCAGVVSDCAIRETPRTSVPRVLACWHSDRPTWDMKNIWLSHFILTETHQCYNYSPSYFNKKILRVDSSRRARGTAAMLDHSRHPGESATKTVKFFVAHTVNCVICNNHTMIDWMLLNFTPVIQQNCHQPGRQFEKSFCTIDRLSC